MQQMPKQIFVVDDEPDILEFLQDLLEEEGYTVVTSPKAEALEHLSPDSLPQLILLDVLLSGRDGREIVKNLKGKAETKAIPIIMFSARPSVEETARVAGADDFVAKPFPIEVLLTKIAHFLS